MVTFVALWATPDDREGFDAHYRESHMPLVRQWPDVGSARALRVTGTPRGSDAPYHAIAVVEFADAETMRAALSSEPGMATAKDAMAMQERFGTKLTMLLTEDF